MVQPKANVLTQLTRTSTLYIHYSHVGSNICDAKFSTPKSIVKLSIHSPLVGKMMQWFTTARYVLDK